MAAMAKDAADPRSANPVLIGLGDGTIVRNKSDVTPYESRDSARGLIGRCAPCLRQSRIPPTVRGGTKPLDGSSNRLRREDLGFLNERKVGMRPFENVFFGRRNGGAVGGVDGPYARPAATAVRDGGVDVSEGSDGPDKWTATVLPPLESVGTMGLIQIRMLGI